MATFAQREINGFEEETRRIAEQRAEDLKTAFLEEVNRLLICGGVDPANHNRGLVFAAALQNLADMNRYQKDREYKNLRKF